MSEKRELRVKLVNGRTLLILDATRFVDDGTHITFYDGEREVDKLQTVAVEHVYSAPGARPPGMVVNTAMGLSGERGVDDAGAVCDCGCHKTGHEQAIPHKGPWKCCDQAVMAAHDVGVDKYAVAWQQAFDEHMKVERWNPKQCPICAWLDVTDPERRHPDSPATPSAGHAALLGQRVRVVIERGGPVVVEGKLLSFGNSGEFVTQDDEGFVHYSWPLLDIEAAPSQGAD